MTKRALLGLHNEPVLENLSTFYQATGFVVTETGSLQEMRYHAERQQFDIYTMDPNLGKPGDMDIAPALTIRALIKGLLSREEARLIALTGHPAVAELCREAGLETYVKGDCKIFDLTALAKHAQRS
jgi:hypothetical protein